MTMPSPRQYDLLAIFIDQQLADCYTTYRITREAEQSPFWDELEQLAAASGRKLHLIPIPETSSEPGWIFDDFVAEYGAEVNDAELLEDAIERVQKISRDAGGRGGDDGQE